MAYDFKKEFRDLYQPKAAPALVDVPAMTFAAVAGAGDPNEEGGALYSSIKKSTFRSAGFRHFAGKRRRTSHPSLPISRASAPRPSSCSGR